MVILFPLPLALLALGGIGAGINFGANFYSNQYTKRGYQRQLADWNKNVGSQGRSIRYPELSYEGNAFRSDLNSIQSFGSLMRSESMYQSMAQSQFKAYHKSLYGQQVGKTSRWL